KIAPVAVAKHSVSLAEKSSSFGHVSTPSLPEKKEQPVAPKVAASIFRKQVTSPAVAAVAAPATKMHRKFGSLVHGPRRQPPKLVAEFKKPAPVLVQKPAPTPVPTPETVVEVQEVIQEEYDEKQLTAELNEVNKTCQTYLLDLMTAGDILDHSIGADIAKQATTFLSTIEQKNEESNDKNIAVKKAIANQMSYIHEKGQHVNYDAPEVTSVQQLLDLLKKAKK
ncbi:hypothetical protein TVAG_227240, partial [Trichomonas vaginalis G3]